MHRVKTAQFEGPLDLLLQLIEEQKLTVTDVALAEVTEQYLLVLQQAGAQMIRTEELADFLVVAARLLLLKSRALLPFLEWGDDEGEELTTQLLRYKVFVDASRKIRRLLSSQQQGFARDKLRLSDEAIGFQPPPGLIATRLAEVYIGILRGLEPLLQLPTDLIRRTISLEDKIEKLRNRIFEAAMLKFSEVLAESKDKTDVIVSFLAILELVKQKAVVVRQESLFEDITIQRVSTNQ